MQPALLLHQPSSRFAMSFAQVLAAAWHLERLASKHQDASMAALAGQLLAAAGPLDPQALALDVPDSPENASGSIGAEPISLNLLMSGGRQEVFLS